MELARFLDQYESALIVSRCPNPMFTSLSISEGGEHCEISLDPYQLSAVADLLSGLAKRMHDVANQLRED